MFSGKPSEHKLIRCPILGYISIPKTIIKAFIDTPIFQRLKNIEQTSMRPLYPSAFHTRFVHSLGVYHLSRIAFHHIQRNTNKSILGDIDLEKYEYPFIIAGLMHDCGHAPFSHLFEDYYSKTRQAEQFLLREANNAEFLNDFNARMQFPPKPHEIFSAAIFLKHYRLAYKDNKPEGDCPDALFVARMITGCTHLSPLNTEEKIENALIKMLNGGAIDLDKLDYIMRDTWNSGVNNVSIDIHRLLLSLKLVEYESLIVPAFQKSALSVIQNVFIGRNYFYRWIFNHHIVMYFSQVLKKAIQVLFKVISGNKPDKIIELVFSEKSFSEVVQYKDKKFYLPADYDFYSLLKQYSDHPELKDYAQEIFSRLPQLMPLWKTREEFELIFEKNKEGKQRDIIKAKIPELLSGIIQPAEEIGKIIIIDASILDFPEIDENKLFVEIRNRIISYKTLMPQIVQSSNEGSFFYVYIPREFKDKIDDCINKIENAKIDC